MPPAIVLRKEFDKEAPARPSRGTLRRLARELGPTHEMPSSKLVVPRHLAEEAEAVRAQDGLGVTMQTLEIAVGTRPRGERQTRRARWAILTYCASLLNAPASVKDGQGNLLRNDGEGSKDYGVLELDGAIRMLMGADLVR